MYNSSTDISLNLTVNFSNTFKIVRKNTTLSFQVVCRFEKGTSPDFLWKGTCVITSNKEVIWNFDKKCPYSVIQSVKQLYPDDKILKIYDEMLMLSNV